MAQSIYDFQVEDINGNSVSLTDYKDKTLLFVNVASKCGFTPQYDGLETLYNNLKDKGVVVLGFPCNQFGAQEPGSSDEIKEFCTTRFSVSFPMFKKIDVNGDNAAPLYNYMKEQLPGIMGSKAVKWNFTKFLFDKNGKPIKRFAPKDTPESIEQEILKIL